jgi:hypothetical protein
VRHPQRGLRVAHTARGVEACHEIALGIDELQ